MPAGSVYNGRQKRALEYDTGTQYPAPEFAFGTATLTSAAAGTAVNVVSDAQVGPDRKFYPMQIMVGFDGTVWSGSTAGANVKVQDTNGTPVDFATVLKAALDEDLVVSHADSNITVEPAMSEGSGGTLGKGVQVVGDVNFDGGLGSLKVTVFGLIA